MQSTFEKREGPKKRIAISINIMSPNRMALFEHLARVPGIDLYVLFSNVSARNREWQVDLDRQFRYKVLPNWTLEFGRWEGYSLELVPTLPFELLATRPDAVVIVAWASLASHLAFVLCKLWRIPLIMWSGSTIHEPSLGRALSKPLVRFMVEHCDAYIAYGTRAKEYLLSLGAREQAIFLAYNTVDIAFFSQQSSSLSAQQRQGIKMQHGIETEKVVLYVGQLIERKGVRYLVDAFARLKQEDGTVGLAIVGYGPQQEDLRRYCVEEDIRDVYFFGYVDTVDLPKIYGVADLFVLPSTEEVWGLVLNEAMACGLPVIATNVAGASADLVREGVNGYVVEAGNEAQLYEAMRRILSDPGRGREMGAESREIVLSGFTLDHAVQGIIQAIRHVFAKAC